jgi:structural maintenance of chromosomes protein 5
LFNYKTSAVQRSLATKKLQVFENSTGNVDEAIRLQQRQIEDKRNLYEIVKRTYDSIKQRIAGQEKEALELTDGLPPEHKKFKYKAKFEKLPDTSAELQNQIEEHQGRIDCIQGVDPRIVQEYEDRGAEIKVLEEQLANEKKRLEKMEEEIQELHEVWHPAIEGIVQSINTNFSSFFNKMGFVGEVEMMRKEEVSGRCWI